MKLLVSIRERLNKIFDSPLWRPLGGTVAVLVVLLVIYTYVTVHAHNTDLDCIKRLLYQVLLEALDHAPLQAPGCGP